MKNAPQPLKTELLDANELLRTVIDENPNVILMKDWDGKFLIGNRALADLYGTTPQELVGKDDGAFNPNTEQVDFFLKNVREIMSQSETRVVLEESTNASTGEVSYYQSIKKPLITKDGKKQILVIANDVTELKRVQKRLEESERRLRYVLEATGEGVWDWNIATGLVTHNHQWCRIIGVDDDHLAHSLEIFSALLHEDDRDRVLERLQSCLAGRTRYQSEHRMRLQDGGVVWVLDRGDVVERDAAGAPLRMVGSFVDISERKAAELALGVRTEMLNAIFELSPDGFISFDESLRVTYASPAFTRMTGMQFEPMRGLSETEFATQLNQLCTASGKFRGFEALRQSAGQQPSGEREFIELTRAGQRTLEVGLRSSATSAVSQILYFRDVTHETEVDQMKSEFLATAAHELRTPMASIYGFTEVLLTQDLDEASRKEFLAIIFRQAELMASILNELLDLARIEARRGKDFQIEETQAQKLVLDVVAGFKPPPGRAAPTLNMPHAPLVIVVDRQKAAQAIVNVLSNAYKYSGPGTSVSISAQWDGDALNQPGGGAPQVAIRIADQGIGMTPEQCARVSERFYRADASGAIPGSGLGMSIVQEIVELHHGKLQIESQAGQGTTVTLLFPSAVATP
jgi:PAS domain S-box-containing protein